MQELNGYIKLYRKLIQWGWYQDNVVKSLFLHFLLTDSFKDFDWMGEKLKAGQLITGRKKLAEELNFSERQIRTAMEKLKSTGEVTYKTTNKFTIVTVVNWEDYQICEETPTKSATNERPTLFEKNLNDIVEKLQKTTNTTTNENDLKDIIKSGVLEIKKLLETNAFANERPTKDQQKTNERPHRKNVKNYKNVKNSSNAHARTPQLFEIQDFINENKLNVDADKFFLHYSKSDWKTKDGKPITDWQELLKTWNSTEKKEPAPYPNGYSNVNYLGDD